MGWAEFLPRYLLIEDQLKDRRVLEIGTRDPRSLSKLQEAGATRVVGTTVNPGAFERTRFRSPSVELLAMDSGRIDFGDLAFDVILVVDLGIQLSHNPRFLEEIKRVLSPDGFCMLAFPGPGRDLTHLLDAEPDLSVMATNHLEAAVRQAFPQTRLLQQAPFVGVAIHPQGRPPGDVDVALEPALAGGVGRPSQVLALCGRGAPTLSDRTLVELPFSDFEAMTDAAQARVSSDIRRLLGALEEARATAEAREISLREVRQRLPKLRAALQKKLQAGPLDSVSQIVSPTVLERPELTEAGPGDTVFVPEPVPTVLEEAPAYLDLQTQIQGLLASDATHVQALSAAKVLQDEMQIALAESESQLQTIRREATPAEDHEDARRRIAQLEHTLGNYEQQIHGLQEELEAEKEVRYTLGSDHRDVEVRMNHVRAQLEQQVLLRSQAEARLQEREVFLAGALSEVDHDRDTLRVRVRELEVSETQYKERMRLTLAASEHAQQSGAQSLAQTDALHRELDVARAEAQRFGRDNGELRNTLRAQEAVLAQALAKDVDRRAVEMAAAHLSREVESLRRRVQDLRNDRDTLAATSQMLLEERDTARGLARRAVGAERSAATLSQTLGEAEQIIEGHEVEARASQDRIENLHRSVAELREDNQGLKGDLKKESRASQSLQDQCSDSVLRVQRLDQHLAGVQAELRDATAARANLHRERDDLEEMLRELASTARAAVRDVARGEQVQLDLRGQISALIDERADIEAARGRAEAEHVAAVGTLTTERLARAEAVTMLAKVQGDRASLKDRLHQTSERIEALSGQLANALEAEPEVIEAANPEVTDELERLRKAKSDADIGLGRTLAEAAKLSDRVSQMQRELDDAAIRLQKGEVERLAVERHRRSAADSAKSAEAARLQGLAEIQVLRERAKRLEFERADLVRDCDARAMRAQQQQRRIGELQGEYSSLEANAQAVEQAQLQKLQGLQDEIQGLTAAAPGAEQASRADLESRLESSQTRVVGLAGEVARLTHERGAFVAQAHELQDQIEVKPAVSLASSHIEAEADSDPSWVVDTLRAQVEGLRGGQAVLRSSLIERDEDLAAVRACNEELRSRAEHLMAPAQPSEPELFGMLAERLLSTELMAEAARAESQSFEDRHDLAKIALQEARAEILHLGVRCEELELVVEGLRGARSIDQGRAEELSSLWRQAEEAQGLQLMLSQGLVSEQDGLRQDSLELRAQMQTAQTRTQQAQWYLGEREAELAVARVDLSAARQALDAAQLEASDLRGAVQAAQRQTHQAEAGIAGVQSQREQVERALAEASEKLAALETAAVDAEYRAQSTDDELQAVQRELDALAEQSEQSRADLEHRVRDAEAAKALVAQAHDSTEAELKSAQDSLREMQQEAERSEAAFGDRGAELARQRSDYEAAMDEAQGQAETAARAQAELAGQVEQLRAELAKVEAALRQAEAGLEQSEVVRGKAEDEASSLANQVVSLVAESETHRSQVELVEQALQAQADAAIEAQSLSDVRVAELEGEIKAVQSELEVAVESQAKFEADVQALELAGAEAAAQLQSQLDSAESEAKSDAAEAADLMALLEGEAAEAATAREDLTAQIAALESLRAEAQTGAQAAQEAQAELTTQCADLSTKNDETEARAARLASEVADLIQAQSLAEAVHSELEQSRVELLAELSAAQAAQTEGKVALAAAEDAVSRGEQAIIDREREFEDAKAQLHSEAAAGLAAKQSEFKDAQADADEVHVAARGESAEQLATLKAEVAASESALAEAESALVKSQDEVVQAHSDTEAARALVESVRNEDAAALATAEAALTATQSALDEAEAALAVTHGEAAATLATRQQAWTVELETVQTALAEAETACAAGETALAASQDEARAVREESQAEVAAATQAQGDLEAAKRAIEQQATDAEHARAELQGKLDSLVEVKTSVEDELKAALQEGERIQAELGGLRAESQSALAAAQTERGKLQEELSEVQSQLSALNGESGVEATARADAQESLRTSQAELEAVAEARAALKAEHQARVDECAGLKLDVGIAAAAKAKAEEALADVQMASIEAEVAHQAMRARCVKLEAAGRQLLGERARLVGELSNAQAQAQAAPTSPDNEGLSRVLARAGDAEMRAERAEAKSERARSEADAATLSTAQAGERLKAAEARADRAEQSLRKEAQRAMDAEGRAVHAEAAVQENRGRAQDLEARRRGLEARVLEADKKSEHSGRRVEELSAQMRQIEARQRSAGEMPASEADLQAEVRGLQRTVAERDLDTQRLEALSEQASQALDEARADTGRRLNELKGARERLQEVQTELVEAQAQAQALDARLQASGDSAELKAQLALHSAEIARLNASGATLQGERSRLHTLIGDSEQRQVQGERRVAELEAALSERTHRIEMLTREIQEKNERLRRLSGLE